MTGPKSLLSELNASKSVVAAEGGPANAGRAKSYPGLTGALLQLADLARDTAERLGPDIERAAAIVAATVKRRGTIFFCGNGGSAADAQHMATEYVVRYMRDRKAYPAIALTTDTSLLTAAGNDFGFDHIFSRQVEALCKPGDLLIIHSTSGNSPNVLKAAQAAKEGSVTVIAFSARDGGDLKDLVDLSIVVPTDRTDRAQEIHLCIEHLICDAIEQTLPN
ncbi:MAG: SIS domain-containing protein [Gemmatimonadaceae bacterium]